jgi:LPS O-antigen subunit length determinant protein (WzzB/FepE family)
MDDPEKIGYIAGGIVSAVVLATTFFKRLGVKLFSNDLDGVNEKLDQLIDNDMERSMEDMNDKLDHQNNVLTAIGQRVAVFDERLSHHDRRITRLEK